MKRLFIPLLVAAFLVLSASGQESPAPELKLPYGTAIPAELSKGLSTRKSKVGDKVEARIVEAIKVNGEVLIPRNSKLLGEVSAVVQKNPAEGANARLRVIFSSIELKGGKVVSVPLVLQKVEAANDQGYNPTLGGPRTASGAGSGAGYESAGLAETNKELLKDTEHMNATGGKVVGFSNLLLAIPRLDVKEGSTFITTEKEVDIPAGTKLLVFSVEPRKQAAQN